MHVVVTSGDDRLIVVGAVLPERVLHSLLGTVGSILMLMGLPLVGLGERDFLWKPLLAIVSLACAAFYLNELVKSLSPRVVVCSKQLQAMSVRVSPFRQVEIPFDSVTSLELIRGSGGIYQWIWLCVGVDNHRTRVLVAIARGWAKVSGDDAADINAAAQVISKFVGIEITEKTQNSFGNWT